MFCCTRESILYLFIRPLFFSTLLIWRDWKIRKKITIDVQSRQSQFDYWLHQVPFSTDIKVKQYAVVSCSQWCPNKVWCHELYKWDERNGQAHTRTQCVSWPLPNPWDSIKPRLRTTVLDYWRLSICLAPQLKIHRNAKGKRAKNEREKKG